MFLQKKYELSTSAYCFKHKINNRSLREKYFFVPNYYPQAFFRNQM